VRELAIKEAKGITAGTDQLRADAGTILAAMRAYKSPLGSTSSVLLPLSMLPSMADDRARSFQPAPPPHCNPFSTIHLYASRTEIYDASASASPPKAETVPILLPFQRRPSRPAAAVSVPRRSISPPRVRPVQTFRRCCLAGRPRRRTSLGTVVSRRCRRSTLRRIWTRWKTLGGLGGRSKGLRDEGVSR
jgi:hypothetical protein